jgi:hypothetical protein
MSAASDYLKAQIQQAARYRPAVAFVTYQPTLGPMILFGQNTDLTRATQELIVTTIGHVIFQVFGHNLPIGFKIQTPPLDVVRRISCDEPAMSWPFSESIKRSAVFPAFTALSTTSRRRIDVRC